VPTAAATYATETSPLTLGGTASDNVAVTQVTWSNDRGGSGTATGTANWSVNGITLATGTNVLTVTARDAAGNSSTDTLTVTYNPPPVNAPPTIQNPGNRQSTLNQPTSLQIVATDPDAGDTVTLSTTDCRLAFRWTRSRA
jgi:hypothetical protein